MEKTVSTYDAKAKLSELLRQVGRGESITITRNGKKVARLVPVDGLRKPRRLGCMKNKVLGVADDFDAPLEDFAEYQ